MQCISNVIPRAITKNPTQGDTLKNTIDKSESKLTHKKDRKRSKAIKNNKHETTKEKR